MSILVLNLNLGLEKKFQKFVSWFILGIDDLCLKYFVEAGAMGVRRVKKVDLKRIAKATGATFLTSLSNMDGNKSYN